MPASKGSKAKAAKAEGKVSKATTTSKASTTSKAKEKAAATTKSTTKSKANSTTTQAKAAASKKAKASITKKADDDAELNLKKEKSKEKIKKTFGSARADLIIKHCIEYNLIGQLSYNKEDDDELSELAYNKEWYCYLCCSKDVNGSTENCCNRFVCQEHAFFDRHCFLCELRCHCCEENWCAEGHIVCKDCLDKEEKYLEDSLEDCWDREGRKEELTKFLSKASPYLNLQLC